MGLSVSSRTREAQAGSSQCALADGGPRSPHLAWTLAPVPRRMGSWVRHGFEVADV